MTHDSAKFLNAAWQAANAAGEVIRASWHQPRSIDYKGPIDLVTSVDRAAEQSIVEVLRREFPEHSGQRVFSPRQRDCCFEWNHSP